mgnify:CR=1 FL=1
MSIEKKITSALSRSVCGGWDRSFLESILEQVDKGRELSVKQKQTLGKVLSRNSEDAQTFHNQWEEDYFEKYQNDAKVLAKYHTRQPYYRPMAKDILAGEVPQMQKFLRMYNNKYSKKVLEAHRAEAKYSSSDHVSPRSNFSPYKHVELEADNLPYESRRESVEKFKKHGGFILQVCNEVYSHAKGAKRYKILPIGATIPLIIEERHIKQARNIK